MNKKRLYLIIIVLLFVSPPIIFGIKAFQHEENFQIGQKTEVAEENRILQEISADTGINPSWLALRNYIYCTSLKKGLKRSDVEKKLSRIGKILIWETQIDFEDRMIDTHLGPVMVIFDSPGPNGELLKWSRSSEQGLGQPLADCEKDQKMFDAP